jgi:membrane-bound ClpP family serine protease
MTPTEAYEYIANILPDFQRKGETLYTQLHAANILRVELRDSNLDDSEISQVYDEIQQDLNQWLSIKNKLAPILTVFGYTGLGIDPVTLLAIGGTLIVIAALLVSFYNSNQIDRHSEAIKRIASYVNLTPEDRTIVNEATNKNIFGFGSLGDIGKYLLWGGAIYLAILIFKK